MGAARTLLIACGALARETLAAIEANGLDHVDVTCLSALLHNRPERIPEAVRGEDPRASRRSYARILVLYGDCGTGGELDRVLAEEGVERIGGPHCYAFYAGAGGVRRAGRRRARHVLPHRLPGPAVRHAGDRGAGPRPASRAAADVFRQLPARWSISPRPRTPSSQAGGPGRGRAAGPRLRVPLHRARRARRLRAAAA